MSTISDVARRAGVSTMTVSRVINNSGYASPEARERVLAAVAELSYVPNALARSLHVKRTHTLALVLTDIGNPFFTTVARGVEDAASRQGFSVMFCNTDESEEEEVEHVRLLLQKQVDGLLLVPAASSTASIDLARRRGVPVVVLDRTVSSDVDTVRCDSEGGAHAIVRHLIDLGHCHVAVLSAAPDTSVVLDRVAGARRAFGEAGMSLDNARVIYGRPETASGREMARTALALEPRPTALFATNNFIAIGAFAALREAGLEVPGDVSLAGFDDLPDSLMLDPFLTVTAQPAYEMGRQGAELLLQRLAKSGPPGPVEVVLPTELVVRRSTGSPGAEALPNLR